MDFVVVCFDFVVWFFVGFEFVIGVRCWVWVFVCYFVVCVMGFVLFWCWFLFVCLGLFSCWWVLVANLFAVWLYGLAALVCAEIAADCLRCLLVFMLGVVLVCCVAIVLLFCWFWFDLNDCFVVWLLGSLYILLDFVDLIGRLVVTCLTLWWAFVGYVGII